MNGDDAKPTVVYVDFSEPAGPAIFAFFRRQSLRRQSDLRRQRRRKGFELRCGDALGRARLRIVK
jgi:hypothetical protein